MKIKIDSTPKKDAHLMNEPIYRAISRFSVSTCWFLALCIHLSIYLIVGLLFDHFYPHAENVLRIRDLAEIVNGVNVWVIFVPMVWGYYRWLPESFYKTAKTLEERKIITEGLLSTAVRSALNARWIHLLSVIATGLSFSYLYLYVIPVQGSVLPSIDFWYYTRSNLFIFSLLYMITNYILFNLIFRALSVSVTLYKYFQTPDSILVLYPLHPDKCGGISSIGELSIRVSLFGTFFPIYITILSTYTLLAGGSAQFLTYLVVYVVYLICIFLLLLFLIWQPHKAMARYKHKLLATVSESLFNLEATTIEAIKNNDWNKLKGMTERQRTLESLSEMIEKHLPVWPLSLTQLQVFSAIASSPVIPGLLSFSLDYLLGLLN